MRKSATKPATIRMRLLDQEDLPDILDIEKASFEEPWRKVDFERQIARPGIHGVVADLLENHDDYRVVGYVILEVMRRKIDVRNMAVAPDMLRLGIGTALVAELSTHMRMVGLDRVTMAVDERNVITQLFLRQTGFVRYGTVKLGQSTDDDTYLFEMVREGCSPSPVPTPTDRDRLLSKYRKLRSAK